MTEDILTAVVDRIALLPQPQETDPVRIWTIVVSTPPYVLQTIRKLHVMGYAEVGMWSPAQPIPATDYVITIHTRRPSRELDIVDRAGS